MENEQSKGILERYKSEVIPFNSKSLTMKEFQKFWNYYEEIRIKQQREKDKRIKANFKELNRISKALNEPIPDELAVIIYLDNPIGSFWYEKYEKWFKYDKSTA